MLDRKQLSATFAGSEGKNRRALAGGSVSGWIKCSDVLPEPGELVVVFSPPGKHDSPEDHRIEFDFIDPDSDGGYWFQHGEHYEHYCCVAKGGDSDWVGPSEKAPYTHWMSIPPIPIE